MRKEETRSFGTCYGSCATS